MSRKANTTTLPVLLAATVLLGTLYHLQSRASPLVVDGHLLPSSSSSYFAQKSNVLNQYFVKKAWAWTTAAWAGLLAIKITARGSRGKPKPPIRGRPLVNSVVLYLVATFYWILITRWAWGPGIVERLFVQTGGRCIAIATGQTAFDLDRDDSLLGSGRALNPVDEEGGQGLIQAGDLLAHDFCSRKLPKSMTSASHQSGAKTALRGQWTGGFDLSGHVFLLVHAILLLTGELPRSRPKLGDWTSFVWSAVVALIGLWWFMLLMTSLFFHTPGEKVVGLLLGLAEWSFMEVVLRL